MIKYSLKKAIGSIIYNFKKKFGKKDKLTIFLFHEISNQPSLFQKKYNIYHSISDFKKILNWINQNYNIISPLEIQNKIENKALITFDDGYLGTFKNAVPMMLEKKIPSIHFLNMGPILNHEPNIVSKIDYLSKYDQNFIKFLFEKKIKKKTIYNINPKLYEEFMKNHKIEIDKIINYQGNLINEKILNQYSENNLVFLGNHMYDHWNIIKLDSEEIEYYYYKNLEILKKYKNFLNIFSFTHGIPNLNFSKKNLNQILSFKPLYIFYSSGGNKNHNNLIFDRTFSTNEEIENKIFYFRQLRSKYLFNF